MWNSYSWKTILQNMNYICVKPFVPKFGVVCRMMTTSELTQDFPETVKYLGINPLIIKKKILRTCIATLLSKESIPQINSNIRPFYSKSAD